MAPLDTLGVLDALQQAFLTPAAPAVSTSQVVSETR